MQTSLDIIKELIHWYEMYQKEQADTEAGLESFILWLNSRLFTADHKKGADQHSDSIDMELAFLLVMQSRYYKAYAKKVLGNSELSSPDGFSFLLHLSLVPSYRKMELIKMHHLEPPSGIEVMKRLLQRQFIEEFDDPQDKRAKRISITDKGRAEIHQLMPLMKEVFQMMTANMSLNEKLHVLAFLKQMNEFHENRLKSK